MYNTYVISTEPEKKNLKTRFSKRTITSSSWRKVAKTFFIRDDEVRTSKCKKTQTQTYSTATVLILVLLE